MQKIIPNLWFNDNAEEAVNFYIGIFKNSEILNVTHYGKSGAEVSGRPEGSILTITFKIEGQTLIIDPSFILEIKAKMQARLKQEIVRPFVFQLSE